MFPDGTCRFLVFDFDNHDKDAEEHEYANTDDSWIDEVEALREIGKANGIPMLVERSRSGRERMYGYSLMRRFPQILLANSVFPC